MEKMNLSESSSNNKTKLSPEVKKYLRAISLSVGLLLWWNWWYKNEAQAQMWVSPNPTNLTISPFYASVPWNIYHDLLDWNNTSNFSYNKEKLEQISFKILNNSNILKDKDKNIKITKQIIDYLVQINSQKNEIEPISFLNSFIEIWEQNWLSEKEIMEIFELYAKNNLIPDNIKQTVLLDLQRIYSLPELNIRLNQVKDLYNKTGKITQDEFNSIFKEYILKQKDQSKINFMIILFAILWPTTWIWATFLYVMWQERKKLQNKIKHW